MTIYVVGEAGLLVVQVGDEATMVYGEGSAGVTEFRLRFGGARAPCERAPGNLAGELCHGTVPIVLGPGLSVEGAPVVQEAADAGGVLAVEGEERDKVADVQFVPVVVYVLREADLSVEQADDDVLNVWAVVAGAGCGCVE